MGTSSDRRMSAWAARLASTDAPAAARLRLLPGVEAACVNGHVWLRGVEWSETIEVALNHLAPQAVYSLGSAGELIPRGNLLPTADLPQTDWTPAREFFQPVVDRPVLSAVLPNARCELQLIRSSTPHDASGLTTSLQVFAAWCAVAAAVRLQRLRYAVDGSRAIVLGSPLPPVPGEHIYLQAGIAIPCGFALTPAIDASSLRRLLNLEHDDDVLLLTSEGWQLITASSFHRR